MKKSNSRKPNLSVKKPSAKGVALKSEKNENGLWLYGFAARIVKRLKSYDFYRITKTKNDTGRENEKRMTATISWNLKSWHKISAAFVSIAIIGIVVFFQFAPENARSKTFPPKADLRPRRMRLGSKPRADTFSQTAWNTVALNT